MFGIKTKLKRCVAHFLGAGFKSAGKKSIEDLPFYKKIKVFIPTYEGSSQVVHPDILVQKDSPKYVLAFTPYPNTNDKFENPSIVISDNGIRFYEEKNGLNPLAPTPAKDHNDDPDLSFKDGIYSMLYLETVRPDYQNLMLLTSKNRVDWNKQIFRHEKLQSANDMFMLSPAVVYSKNECFLFYVQKNLKNGNALFAIKGNELKSLDFESPVPLKLNGISSKLQPWHVDVFPDDKNGYVMLLSMVTPYSASKQEYSLFVATSKNLTDWEFQNAPVLKNCYRSSGFVKNDVLYIYFSSNIYADVWKTGLFKCYLR